MDPAIAATLVAVMVSALLGVFVGAFHLLRSDLKELRAENRADHRETNARIDRLEGKLDSLILALARVGYLTDAKTSEPPANSSPAQAD